MLCYKQSSNLFWTRIEIPQDKSSPGSYSHLFLVPKPNNQWRSVINPGLPNNYVKIPKLKMDTPQKVWAFIRIGRWVFSLDLKDAFFRIPINLASKKFLRMELLGTVQFRALPFGISMAL